MLRTPGFVSYCYLGIFSSFIAGLTVSSVYCAHCVRARRAQGASMSVTGDTGVSLEVVTERRQWKQFLALPHRLYASDPAWVAPLNFEQRHRFSPANHFFEHARFRAWIACRQGRVVGRITAQIDELHLQQHRDGAGYFGMLEAQQALPGRCGIAPLAEEFYRGSGLAVAELIEALRRMDGLLSEQG